MMAYDKKESLYLKSENMKGIMSKREKALIKHKAESLRVNISATDFGE